MRGGCLQPPNPELQRIKECESGGFNEGGLSPAPELNKIRIGMRGRLASMRGGCLQPPNDLDSKQCCPHQVASMRGGCLQPPNSLIAPLIEAIGWASMRGGCLQPPN